MTENSVENTEDKSLEIQRQEGSLDKIPSKFQKFWPYKIGKKIYQHLLINLSELPNAEIFRIRYSKNWKLGATWIVVLFVSTVFWLVVGFLIYYFFH